MPNPRKPTSLKILQGNPGHRPLSRSEPQPEKQAPPCPDWLSPGARKKWAELAPVLEGLGLLSELDGDMFGAYCHFWDQWQRMERLVRKRGSVFTTPSGYVQQRPELAIAKRAYAEVYRLGREFGFTPSSRGGIEVSAPQEPDPLEKYLRGDRRPGA